MIIIIDAHLSIIVANLLYHNYFPSFSLDNILWKNLCFAKWPRILAQEGYNYNDDQSNNNNNNTTRISSWKKLYADKTSLDRSWRKKGMNKCTTIRAHAGKLWAAVFDDELLITASADRSMRLWDVNTLRPLRTVDSTHELLTLQFDKQRIVTGGLGNGTVDIWDLHKILEGSTTTTGDNEEDNGDATTTAAAAAAAATAAPVVRPSHSFVAHSRSYMVSSVQYDDQKLVTSGGFSVKIWDFNDQPLKLIAKLPDEDWGLIECVRFDANHSTNFTTTKTKSSNGTTTRLRGGDPNMLMTGSVSGYVRVWDLRTPHTGSVVQFAQPGFTPVNWIQFDSSCGDMWCACDDGKARRWDVRFPAKPIYTLHVCNGNVWRVAYDYEIGVMVTSSEPNVVKVWDMGDKKMAPLSITTDDDDEYSIGIISASTSGQFPCAQTLTPQQGNSFNAKVSSVRMSHSKLVLGTWDGLLKVYEFDKRSFRIVR
eukprot:GEZU01019732.1.p1 GENE.GEZU01019732.1~~GEZU01019732.1.p1  ORF type:complete len:481 (-),score=129.86 GEZU01019732.1:1251-2693(-)